MPKNVTIAEDYARFKAELYGGPEKWTGDTAASIAFGIFFVLAFRKLIKMSQE